MKWLLAAKTVKGCKRRDLFWRTCLTPGDAFKATLLACFVLQHLHLHLSKLQTGMATRGLVVDCQTRIQSQAKTGKLLVASPIRLDCLNRKVVTMVNIGELEANSTRRSPSQVSPGSPHGELEKGRPTGNCMREDSIRMIYAVVYKGPS